jgi:hypothetical protein
MIALTVNFLCKRPVCPILPGMNRPSTYRWLSALALLYCLPSLAATVYKSIDEQGVVRFSDAPPQNEILLETVVIDNQASLSSEQAQQNLQNMRETTDRMAADRMAREKHRAEMRELDVQAEAIQAPQYPEYYEDRTTYSGSYNYRTTPYWRRPGHVRPVHPIARPPLRRPGHRPRGIEPFPVSNFPAPHIRPLFTPKVRGSAR